MIQDKSLDPSLEVEAISSANNILNRSPHNFLDGMNPFEAWCRRKLVVKHFRVFGCPAWAHISSRECKAPPSRPCTFISYKESFKAYRLMDPETRDIFIERNVHFEESSPRLSSNPLHTSYTMENDSVSDSIGSDVEDHSEKCRTRSQHQKNSTCIIFYSDRSM